MSVRKYGRHAGGPKTLTTFLFVWSSGWIFGMGSPFVTGRLRMNGREVRVGEASSFLVSMVFVGMVFALAVILWLRRRNDRIDLVGTELRWSDWTGRLRGKADLSEVKAVQDADGFWGGISERVAVETGCGNFSFGRVGTEGFFDLQERLRLAASGRSYDASETLPPPQNGGRTLEPKVYRYRFSGLHAISIFPVAVGAIGLINSLRTDSMTFGFVLSAALVMLGLWGQLIGWNERIEVEEARLRWFDGLGRLNAEIHTDEIFGIAGTHASGGLYRIEGTQATIRFSDYLGQARVLKDNIEALTKP